MINYKKIILINIINILKSIKCINENKKKIGNKIIITNNNKKNKIKNIKVIKIKNYKNYKNYKKKIKINN